MKSTRASEIRYEMRFRLKWIWKRERTSDARDAERLGTEDGEDKGGHKGGEEDLRDAVLVRRLDQVE